MNEIEQKAEEYKALIGKKFKRKDGNGSVTEVVKYLGVLTVGSGKQAHIINVKNNDADWNPTASIFVAEYEEISE